MKTLTPCILVALGALSLSACTTTVGGFSPQSHFDFPNSNIQPLGPVNHSIKRSRFLFPPELTPEDVETLFAMAMESTPGANLIIDYSVDTSVTNYTVIPFYTMEVVLQGTAAKQSIGYQTVR